MDQILTVLSIPQLAMRYMSEGWKSYKTRPLFYSCFYYFFSPIFVKEASIQKEIDKKFIVWYTYNTQNFITMTSCSSENQYTNSCVHIP